LEYIHAAKKRINQPRCAVAPTFAVRSHLVEPSSLWIYGEMIFPIGREISQGRQQGSRQPGPGGLAVIAALTLSSITRAAPAAPQ
jgi:hypothetical protein